MSIYRVKKQVELALSPDVMSGRAAPAIDDYRVVLDEGLSLDLDLLRGLLDHALELDHEKDHELDPWLSPRFHFALRVPRRIAGEPGFWTWLTLEIGRQYTFQRWSKGGSVTMYRYTGDFKRNALARLWWFAEMARNGPSYAEVRNVLRDPSTAQYAMELKYSMYRPAVIAFGRVASDNALGFEALKSLSKRINAYLSLRSLEALGLAEGDGAHDEVWWADRPTLEEVLGDVVDGPQDGYAPERAVGELVRWFTSLLSSPAAVANERGAPALPKTA